MRTLPFLLALAGCLSAPTGRDPDVIDGPVDADVDAPLAWPPAAADIAAVAAGDVDGDGKDDLIAADVAGARIHLLRGGGDIDPTRATVTTATASAPIANLARPVAVRVVFIGGARFIVVADNPGSGPRITVFDMTLTQTGTAAVALGGAPALAPDDVIAITPSTFGEQMNATFITLPSRVYFVEGNRLDDATPQLVTVPAPAGEMFEEVFAATGWVTGAPPTPRVAVAELQRAQLADLPAPGTFNWADVRADADVDWPAQTLVDLGTDTFPEVLGFNADGANPAQLCAVDLQAGTIPTCFASPFGMNTARITTGNVDGGPQPDAVLTDLRLGQATTNVFVVSNLRIATGQLMADTATMPFTVNLPEALPAVLQLDSGPSEIVVVGKNGQIVCARPTTGNNPVAACAP